MGQQAIVSALPATPTGTNISDGDSGSGISQWTGGGTVTTPVPVQAALTERFAIVAWNITLNGSINLRTAGPRPSGRLGKLIGGVFAGSAATTTNVSQSSPWVNPMLPLPENSTSLATLWDGASDPPFPQMSAVGRLISVTFTPPTPLEIAAGEQISIGLWLTPSLITGTTVITITGWNARYTVVYDDQQPPRAGWGGG